MIARDDVDVVDIVTPGDSHAELAIAALAAGKHVLCEKPLANSVAEAEAMADAAAAAAGSGVHAMVGFTYRRVPAVTLMRDLIGEGAIGRVVQVRAAYRQDWLVDPQVPMVWRLITGLRLTEVAGVIETITKRRPLPDGWDGPAEDVGPGFGEVTVDDVAMFTGRFEGGALGSFEATRFATGRKNALTIEAAMEFHDAFERPPGD